MRNLPLPSRDMARHHLEKAIKMYRYKGEILGHTITPEELDQVLALYDLYDLQRAAPSDDFKGAVFPEGLSDALYKAYDLTQETRKLTSIREILFQNITLCPICGIDPVVELDHHLPRSVFKALAIYTRNLVPLCHACNHTKLAGFGAQGEEEKRFLHAYFDELPDVNFFAAKVEIREGGLIVQFRILTDAGLPLGFAERLQEQMTALKLNERYQQEINSYISGHAVSLHLQYSVNGKESVRSFLSLQARHERTAFYRNHWRPTLLAALAEHDAFIDGGFAQVLPLAADILEDMESNV
jgi:hypothetical protein